MMPSRDWSGWFRYGLPGLALGLVLAWSLDARVPSARAQGAGPVERPRPGATSAVENSGTIAFSSPLGGSSQLLYLIDTKTRSLAVYRVDPTNPKGTVKLEAARQYQWDLKLDEYNNQEPSVAAIESTVKSLGRPSR
jgi:hypothetical protein